MIKNFLVKSGQQCVNKLASRKLLAAVRDRQATDKEGSVGQYWVMQHHSSEGERRKWAKAYFDLCHHLHFNNYATTV